MKTIYEWLLYNMGNEANFFTILNCRRSEPTETNEYIRVMARSKEFKVTNLVIGSEKLSVIPEQESGTQDHRFQDEAAVIHYLATGEVKQPEPLSSESSLYVRVDEPVGEAGEITFSPD